MYIPNHFHFCYWYDSSQMFKKSILHILVCLTQILLNLTLKSLNYFYDFVSILLHVSCKLEIFTERFFLIHLNVSWLENMWPDWDFTLNFIFINQPDWSPFSSGIVSQLYVFRCEYDMDIQRTFFSYFHENFIKGKIYLEMRRVTWNIYRYICWLFGIKFWVIRRQLKVSQCWFLINVRVLLWDGWFYMICFLTGQHNDRFNFVRKMLKDTKIPELFKRYLIIDFE